MYYVTTLEEQEKKDAAAKKKKEEEKAVKNQVWPNYCFKYNQHYYTFNIFDNRNLKFKKNKQHNEKINTNINLDFRYSFCI